MDDFFNVKVEGKEALSAKFRRLRDAVYRNQVNQLLENANELADEIQAAAPVGETGKLEISVRVIVKSPLKVFVQAGGPLTRKASKRGVYDYSRAQEFGTVDMVANPFFFPTYRRNKKAMRRKMSNAAKQGIREIFG